MSINSLVKELKQNNEDFEFYPTTDEMLKIIANDIDMFKYEFETNEKSILDIGAGTCKLKHFYDFKTYYAIEKSKVLIGKYDPDIIVVGTDFNQMTLIDKPASFYFCNPPYSQFEDWTLKILREGNFFISYLVIPSRWKDNPQIKFEMERFYYSILASTDFLDAERKARAKVDIIRVKRKANVTDPFGYWFDNVFAGKKRKSFKETEKEEEEEEKKFNQIIESSPNKAEKLVFLYNEEMNRLYNSFKSLCAIDEKILSDIGVNLNAIKESMQLKMKTTKTLYWKKIFELMDEITKRLTFQSRENMFDKFKKNNTIDFNLDNIEAVVIWVLKNANQFYNSQLVELYKKFSGAENVRPYKSNQNLFNKDKWRWRDNEHNIKYTLDYRMIVEHYFGTGLDWNNTWWYQNDTKNKNILNDIRVIARNLGFETEDYDLCREFGKKSYVYQKNGKPLLEYKFYKNGNTHLKLDIEFAKAFNVEVSRLLGWIRNKEDIKKEFPEELSKGAEKYFKTNANFQLTNNNLLLLE